LRFDFRSHPSTAVSIAAMMMRRPIDAPPGATARRTPMLYMLLICFDPRVPPTGNLQPEHANLEQELRASSEYISGAALWPKGAGRRITGAPTDGPFAETKEAVGGYYIVDVAGDAEAEAIARRIPTGEGGWIEVRRIALFHPDANRIAALAR
jgi:hypothetical protein